MLLKRRSKLHSLNDICCFSNNVVKMFNQPNTFWDSLSTDRMHRETVLSFWSVGFFSE